MRPRTIRARITLLAVVVSAGLLIVVSVLMVSVFRWQLTDNLDEGLIQRADTIAGVLAGPLPDELVVDEDLLVQVVDADGDVVLASVNLTGAAPIAPLEAGIRTIDTVAGRDESFRVLTRSVDTTARSATLLVGINNDDVSDPVTIMSWLLATTVPGVVTGLGALIWWLTGRTLRPVEKMRTEMAQISGTNLGRRVPEPGTGDEIDRLAQTMNQTLDRLEDAVRRQQRFVADASHELRGPLTRIRSEVELDLAHPEHADPDTTSRSILDEAIGLQELVDDLLHLARSDAGVAELSLVPLDIDDIVLRHARRLRERGRVRLDTGRVSAAQVDGDRTQLARAVKNLFDNAERHATDTVTVTLDETGDSARLTISDDGTGIPADLRDRIFERFTRLDEARTRDDGGSGLGLAITRDIIERHHGTIHLADGLPTCFVVELPRRS